MTPLPNDFVCSDNAACGFGTVFQPSHKGASRHALAR
jgi:hypothetical protein